MSGAHSQHRTGNRPLFIEGIPMYKLDKNGDIVTRWVTTPGGVYENGRCVEWNHEEVPVMMHVLDYSPEIHRPSKNARGRIRPRTPKQRRRVRNLQARATRISKRITLDANALAAELREAAA